LQTHYKPEIVEAFKIAIDELKKQAHPEKNSTLHLCIIKGLPQIISAQPNQEIQQPINIHARITHDKDGM